MIPVPSGVRVWLAVGHTDMRRGMNSLAVQVQEVWGAIRTPAISTSFRGKEVISSNSLARRDRHVALRQATGARPLHMAVAGRWDVAITARSWPICLMELTGGTRFAPGGRKRRLRLRPFNSAANGRAAVGCWRATIRLVTTSATIEALTAALAAERAARQEAEARASGAEALVAYYKLLIAKLRREQYGQSSERGRKLLNQLELQLQSAARAARRGRRPPPTARPCSLHPQEAGARTLCGASAARARGDPRPDGLSMLWRQARQARRDHHRDAGGGTAPVESDPDRS